MSLDISHKMLRGKSHLWLATIIGLAMGSFLVFSHTSVFAQEANPSKPKTEIIADEVAGTVSIVIDGETVGFFNKHGLHVLGDVIYSGTIRDGGEDVPKVISENKDGGHADEENQ